MLYLLKRLLHIIQVCIKYQLDTLALPKYLSPSTLLCFIPPVANKRKLPFSERVFLAFLELGPLFIKLGQLISIRHDLFDDEITSSLSRLQDQVPPFDSNDAIHTIESDLKQPISALFASFNPIPLASASIAQVHEATLFCGAKVVVKVIRPNLHQKIYTDVKLLRKLIPWITTSRSRLNKNVLLALIDEYEYTLKQEINLSHEACHYSQMRYHFEHDLRLYVPKIYWSHTTKNIMTVEKVVGTPIDEITTIKNINLKQLAYNGVSIFFTQVFEHRFFHADMHPGNVLIDVEDPLNPKYVAIDFGIVGTLSPTDQYYLAENFLAFYHRNYTRIAQLHIESGWVGPNTDIVKFEAAIRHVCEPIFAKTIEEISIAELMQRLIEVSRPFDLKIQPQLLLLQKTLFHVEALGRKLYPKLNLWDATEPFLQKFMKERVSPKSGWKHLKQELPRLILSSPELPYLIAEKLRQKPQDKVAPPFPLHFVLLGVLFGAIVSNPSNLTHAKTVYIMCSVFIIMTVWKSLK